MQQHSLLQSARRHAILSAATKAETACDFIMDCLREMELEEQSKVDEQSLQKQEEER